MTDLREVQLLGVGSNNKGKLAFKTGGADGVFKGGGKNFTVMTDVEEVNCQLYAWKAFLCCKALTPFAIRQAAPIVGYGTPQAIEVMDTIDEYTSCYEGVSGCLVFSTMLCIYCGPRPNKYLMIENFKSKEESKTNLGKSDQTYIARENRTKTESLCGCGKGKWIISKGDSKEPILWTEYRRGCCGMGGKTHYLMRDGENNIVAQHQYKGPLCGGGCSCRMCMFNCYQMCCCCCPKNGCPMYSLQYKIQTPKVPSKEFPKYRNKFETEPQDEEIRLFAPTCISMCCGKGHAKVEVPTFYSAANVEGVHSHDGEETSKDDNMTVNKSKMDNRLIFKDIPCCTRAIQQCSCGGFENGDLPGGFEEMALAAELAAAVAQEGALDGATDKQTNAGEDSKKNWKRSKYDVTNFEFPENFTSSQKAGALLAALSMTNDLGC